MKNLKDYVPNHSYEVEPNKFYSLSFSGGRSSAFMLYKFLEANGGLPRNAVVLFANTGKEHEATLDFVQECSSRWQVPITWLEFDYNPKAKGGMKDPKYIHKIVSHNSASRDGRPFEELIRRRGNSDTGGYLPNKAQRLCTQELKVETMRRYLLRDLGVKSHMAFIGIRFDEPRRWTKAILTEDCRTLYPMVTNLITKGDVLKFWQGQSFDLKTPSIFGNCDLCFMKGRRKLIEAIKQDPKRANWWIGQEERVLKNSKYVAGNDKNARFRYEESYSKLRESALNERLLWDGKFEVPRDEEVNCYCGD